MPLSLYEARLAHLLPARVFVADEATAYWLGAPWRELRADGWLDADGPHDGLMSLHRGRERGVWLAPTPQTPFAWGELGEVVALDLTEAVRGCHMAGFWTLELAIATVSGWSQDFHAVEGLQTLVDGQQATRGLWLLASVGGIPTRLQLHNNGVAFVDDRVRGLKLLQAVAANS